MDQNPVTGTNIQQNPSIKDTVITGTVDTTFGDAGCAIMAVADLLNVSPSEVNDNYVNDGAVNWEKVADANGYTTSGRINKPFTMEQYLSQVNDTSTDYSTLVNVNYNKNNGDHWVGVQGMVCIGDKEYVVITPVSINDKMTTYDWNNYNGYTGTYPYYPQSRADEGWKVVDGKVIVPVEETKAYVNFEKKKCEKQGD